MGLVVSQRLDRAYGEEPRTSHWVVICSVLALTLAKLAGYSLLASTPLNHAMCQWDCGWYISIATHGYDAEPHPVTGHLQANWAFFPLYPALIAGTQAISGMSPETVGLAVSTVCFIAFAALGARYRAITRVSASPWPWLLLLFTWPYSLYFHAPYSEALYALLATATLLALVRQRPITAGSATALLTATRPTGILVAVWIGLDSFWRSVAAGRPAWRFLGATVVAPFGLLAFMTLLYQRIGDPLAFLHIQSGWLHNTSNPLTVFLHATSQLRPGPAYLAVWAILGVAAGGWLAVNRHAAEAWLATTTVLVALASGTLWSMPRFVAANPVFLFAVADVLEIYVPPAGRIVAYIAMGAIQAVLVMEWFRGAAFLA
jgi:hypothetical protein